MFIIICIYDDENTKIYNPVPTIHLKIKDSTNFIESLCVPSQQILPSNPNKEVTTVKNCTYYSVQNNANRSILNYLVIYVSEIYRNSIIINF